MPLRVIGSGSTAAKTEGNHDRSSDDPRSFEALPQAFGAGQAVVLGSRGQRLRTAGPKRSGKDDRAETGDESAPADRRRSTSAGYRFAQARRPALRTNRLCLGESGSARLDEAIVPAGLLETVLPDMGRQSCRR